MEIVFYGVRGTRTVTERRFERVGGDTACVGVRVGAGARAVRMLFDAGTGIAPAGDELAAEEGPVTIFLSHMHHDHLAGLPFFAPLFQPERPVRVFIPPGMTGALHGYFAPPYYPLTVDDLPARVTVTELPRDGSVECVVEGPSRVVQEGPRDPRTGGPGGDGAERSGAEAVEPGATVRSLSLPGEVHPRNGVTLFSVAAGGKKVVYATDFEWRRTSPSDRRRLIDFARNADVFIVDAQYAESEYPGYAGRGHNTVRTAVQIGDEAAAGRIVLFHHDPHRDDDAVAALEAEARTVDPKGGQRVTAAVAGMRFVV